MVGLSLFSQSIQFEEILPQAPMPVNLVEFDYVAQGASEFSDVDGDGDIDLIISGSTSYVGPLNTITRLYLNDGVGNFILDNSATFTGVRLGTVDFIDVDGDSDDDLLITGQSTDGGSSGAIAELYKNDSNGNFTLFLNPFETVALSSVDYADVDGDDDLDVLISGLNMSSVRTTKLYLNDGIGNFLTDVSNSFPGLESGDVQFNDVDGDSDFDVIISGLGNSGELTELYLNDGIGNFTLDLVNSFIGLYECSLAFIDVENDTDPDLIISGRTSAFQSVSKLYKNNGSGVFTEDLGISITGLWLGALEAFDFNGDGYDDFISCGEDYFSGNRVAELYINDGFGGFDLDNSIWFENAAYSAISVSDIDGDSDADVIITGRNEINHSLTRLYINDGNANFRWASRVFDDGVDYSSSDFGDIDNDGDEDLILLGAPSLITDQGKTGLYINDGFGNFTRDTLVQFDGVMQGDVKFFDADEDTDLDVIICGWEGTFGGHIAKFYENDGTGMFIEITGLPFVPVIFSSLDVGDIDNDSDLDVIICGRNMSNDSQTEVYLNDGFGNFSFFNAGIIDIHNGVVKLVDINNDNALDIFVSGYSSVSPMPAVWVAKIYINDGIGNFSELSNPELVGWSESDAQFADFDLDYDLDLIVSGYNGVFNQTKLYKNDGSGIFSESLLSASLPQLQSSSILFNDFDQDGLPDIIISGTDGGVNSTSMFKNVGGVVFSEVNPVPFDQVENGCLSSSDVNGDGRIDVFITGRVRTNYAVAKIFRNITTVGLEQPVLEFYFGIFPNPTDGLITISTPPNTPESHRILIHDTHGKVICCFIVDSYNTIDLSNLPSGIYYVTLSNENSGRQKIIKY